MAYSNQSDSNEFDYIPGYTKNTHEYGTEFGDEFHAPAVVELLASTVAVKQRGVTLAGGQGVLPTGTVLAKATANGRYYEYNAGGSADGRQVALGILRDARDTGGAGYGTVAAYNTATGYNLSNNGVVTSWPASPIKPVPTDCLGNLVYGGTLNLAAVSGTDTTSLVTGAAGGVGSGASGVVTQLGAKVVNFGAGVGTPPFPGSSMDKSAQAVFIF